LIDPTSYHGEVAFKQSTKMEIHKLKNLKGNGVTRRANIRNYNNPIGSLGKGYKMTRWKRTSWIPWTVSFWG
jgi:hypothetical protein